MHYICGQAADGNSFSAFEEEVGTRRTSAGNAEHAVLNRHDAVEPDIFPVQADLGSCLFFDVSGGQHMVEVSMCDQDKADRQSERLDASHDLF